MIFLLSVDFFMLCDLMGMFNVGRAHSFSWLLVLPAMKRQHIIKIVAKDIFFFARKIIK